MVKISSRSVTGAQLRAARALLNLTAESLAEQTKIGLRTIGRAEKENGPVRLTDANKEKLVSVLETMGVIFIDSDTEGPGVRLKMLRPVNLQ
jgi:transcriptional regulator with XRE-family HTH domain